MVANVCKKQRHEELVPLPRLSNQHLPLTPADLCASAADEKERQRGELECIIAGVNALLAFEYSDVDGREVSVVDLIASAINPHSQGQGVYDDSGDYGEYGEHTLRARAGTLHGVQEAAANPDEPLSENCVAVAGTLELAVLDIDHADRWDEYEMSKRGGVEADVISLARQLRLGGDRVRAEGLKTEWPELVGAGQAEAQAAILADRPDLAQKKCVRQYYGVVIVKRGQMYDGGFDPDRVSVFVSDEGRVTQPPSCGGEPTHGGSLARMLRGSGADRFRAHKVAEKLGLVHESAGEGAGRHVVLRWSPRYWEAAAAAAAPRVVHSSMATARDAVRLLRAMFTKLTVVQECCYMGGGCELTREALLAGVDEARRATLPDNLRALWEVRFAAEAEGQPPPRFKTPKEFMPRQTARKSTGGRIPHR